MTDDEWAAIEQPYRKALQERFMLTTKQAAELLDLDPSYVRRLVANKKIKATAITPRMNLIDERDLEAYKQAHPRSKAGRPRKTQYEGRE